MEYNDTKDHHLPDTITDNSEDIKQQSWNHYHSVNDLKDQATRNEKRVCNEDDHDVIPRKSEHA